MLGLGMRRNDDVAPFEKVLFHISTTVVIPAVVTSHVRFFFLSFLLFSFWLHLFSFRGAFFFPPASSVAQLASRPHRVVFPCHTSKANARDGGKSEVLQS
eukprot:GHVU01147826.1.p2 GENE.GHVU01147826.1~~GHVU01147826.1.p2  ORF type:complete len:100 (-),score=4.15 GHVU01147826.1:166-465(-)